METTVHLRQPHDKQAPFVHDDHKRKIARCGRRAGKTVGAATASVIAYLQGQRVLYAVPTMEQVEKWWFEVKLALKEPINAGWYYKHEGRHLIEVSGTENRIRGKTAHDADTLRGDYADLLILDEFQQMKPNAWGLVGAPMLIDNNGDAIFIYTTDRGAKGRHAKEMYKKALENERWGTYRWSSYENPHVSAEAIDEVAQDMTQLAFKAEILAEEVDDDPRALWNRGIINRVSSFPDLDRIVVGVDPPGSEEGAECGIVVAGKSGDKYYILSDDSLRGSPATWGNAAIASYNIHKADRIVAEKNHGGDMVEHTLRSVDGRNVAISPVWASRGKAIRAEPVAAMYEQGKVKHVGEFGELEDQMASWVPGDTSPDRLDALVWAMTDLMEGGATLGYVNMRMR